MSLRVRLVGRKPDGNECAFDVAPIGTRPETDGERIARAIHMTGLLVATSCAVEVTPVWEARA